MPGIKIEWQDMVPEQKFQEAKSHLRKLIAFCCSGRRYERKNPHTISEIREAIKWLYREEFPPEVEPEVEVVKASTYEGIIDVVRSANCEGCGEGLPLKVLKSNAGYYLGFWCPKCGPYDRITVYFQTQQIANEVFENQDKYLEPGSSLLRERG